MTGHGKSLNRLLFVLFSSHNNNLPNIRCDKIEVKQQQQQQNDWN